MLEWRIFSLFCSVYQRVCNALAPIHIVEIRMDVENARRNLKDFLSMYNQFTENCFERCIQNLNYRVLTQQEESCVNKCVSKMINVNHREISVYVEINPLSKRLNELSSATDPQQLLMATSPDTVQEGAEAHGKDPVGEGSAAVGGPESSVTASVPGDMVPSSADGAKGRDGSGQSLPHAGVDDQDT